MNIHWYKKASFTGAGYASAADSGKAVPSPLPGTKGRQTRRVHEGLPVVVEVYSEAKQNPILGPIFILSSIAADAGTAARNLAEAKRGLRCR